MQITAPFKHALLVSDQVSDRAELLGSVIAHAGFGVVFVAADRRIIYANDTAETLMHARGGLRRERNCISTADFTSSRKLQSLITAALRQTHEPAQGGALIHCNEEGEPSLVVHVVPFGQHADLQPDKERPVAGLVIVDCQQGIIDRINAFADLFALTAGEARVVAQLVSGGGVTKAASRLNIAPSTVRSLLTHIMERRAHTGRPSLSKFFTKSHSLGVDAAARRT